MGISLNGGVRFWAAAPRSAVNLMSWADCSGHLKPIIIKHFSRESVRFESGDNNFYIFVFTRGLCLQSIAKVASEFKRRQQRLAARHTCIVSYLLYLWKS
jgi:hypothetical protein